jgi:hypothetical protein
MQSGHYGIPLSIKGGPGHGSGGGEKREARERIRALVELKPRAREQ